MPDTIELNPGGAGSLNIAFKLRYEANENTNAFTDADKAKLAGQETGATADMTPEEVQGAYDSQVPVMSQAEAEAGASTAVRQVTAQRIAQAIAAQVVGGGGNLGTDMRLNGFGIGFAGANATGAQIARLTPVCLDGAALSIAVSEADKTDRLPCIGVAATDCSHVLLTGNTLHDNREDPIARHALRFTGQGKGNISTNNSIGKTIDQAVAGNVKTN